MPTPPLLFRTPAPYVALLVTTVLVCAAGSGLLRKLGAPQAISLRSPQTYAIDPEANPYAALLSPNAVYTGDFRPIFEAAQARLRDPEASLYRSAELDEHSAAFVYTPLAALALVPLARTGADLRSAADTVHRVHRFLWALGGVLLYRVLFRGSRPTLALTGLFAAHYLLYYPLAKALQLTQAGLWIWFGLVLAAFWLQRGRSILGGFALGLGVSIKPHLIIIPLMLAAARAAPARFIWASGVTVVAAGIVSVVYAGPSDCVTYVTETLPHLSAGYAYFPNQSVNGLLHRLLGAEDSAVFNLAQKRAWIQVASGVFALAVLGATFAVLRKSSRTPSSSADGRHPTDAITADNAIFHLALATAAAVIASPVCWIHHYVLLSIPFVVLARRLHPGQAPPAWAPAAAFVSLMLTGWFFDGRNLSGFPGALLTGLEFYGAIGLLTIMVAIARQDARRVARQEARIDSA